ncbi:MAG TPA: CocE/NonD family hydrolase, partial [Acidobacteria bacterium]|nr:CocE/NonD family hydrolase [Acidobacteriota bacterium]
MKRINGVLIALVVILAQAALPAAARGQRDAELAKYIRSHYTKFEYRIPMRDGVKLFTAVYVPNDLSKTYPILMTRTPYAVGPYGANRYKEELGPSAAFARDGYIFVYQDVRGRFMSEGTFVNMRPEDAWERGGDAVDESTDTWDTIEWLVHHVKGNNGKVGMWGVSYPGFYTSCGMIHSHPALKAVSPQAPIADWFWDDMHRNGAFNLVLAFDFFSVFGRPRDGLTTTWPKHLEMGTPDAYDFFLGLGPLSNVNERFFHHEIPFWDEVAAHPNYDEFWQSRNILPHLKNIKAAVMIVGGWFDTEDLYGPLATYRAVEKQDPGIDSVLVMGPWRHGGWAWTSGEKLGEESFGFATAKWFRENVELPFFDHYLKGGPATHQPEALVFETGADRWRSFDSWPPPATARPLYLGENGSLSWTRPVSTGEAWDQYVSDPAKPVPYTEEITTGWSATYMTEDQRFAGRRPDVLVYASEPLKEDLTVAGPIEADLWVSTSGGDSDWIVKVIDVQPTEEPKWSNCGHGWGGDEKDKNAGVQRLVRAEAFRGR